MRALQMQFDEIRRKREKWKIRKRKVLSAEASGDESEEPFANLIDSAGVADLHCIADFSSQSIILIS